MTFDIKHDPVKGYSETVTVNDKIYDSTDILFALIKALVKKGVVSNDDLSRVIQGKDITIKAKFIDKVKGLFQ